MTFADGELAWTSFDRATRCYDKSGMGGGVGKIHPTQKPCKLYEWILISYAKEGDKILDTHLGSGSIAIACHNLGYDLEGYEIDKDYFQAAKKRLKQHQSQMQLFL
jgi:site-specific DNA-methyltransferase (adenine-specific)